MSVILDTKGLSKTTHRYSTKMFYSQLYRYDINQKIVEALADAQSRIILFSIIKEGKIAEEISYETKLPLSTVYKKLADLENLTLIHIERRMISDKGRKFKVYKSRISGARISMHDLEPKINLLPN
ncbi:MAG: ArsR family transcriptional regulator [Nitrososphaera sp.]|jgi:predicted transcriptional regulator